MKRESNPLIYLDHNATTPVRAEVLEAMARAMDRRYANPSSLHQAGRAGRALLEECRERLSRSLGGEAGELIFTSGGTEANRLAILAALEARRLDPAAARGAAGPPRAVVSEIEHPSTVEVYRSLERRGWLRVSWIPAGADGRADPAAIEEAIDGETFIVSLLHASNETGVIQDVAAVARACRDRGVWLHSDAVQSLGKAPVVLDQLGADLAVFSAHKVCGPKGTGALWVRRGFPFRHPLGGGPQEGGRRPGTENLPGAAGFARAVELIELPSTELRDRLWEIIRAGFPNAALNGSPEHLIPNTLNVSFPGVRAETLLIRLDLEGILASSGSACASGAREPSHVLRAMGLPPERVESALRFSLGRETSAAEVERAGEAVVRCAGELLAGGSRAAPRGAARESPLNRR